VTADGTLPRLTAILDADAASVAGWPLIDLARAYLRGGARLLQVRAKHAPGASFLEAASAIVALAHREGAAVIVNDRADIARLAGADGVHVGQDDLAPALVRAIVGDEAIVGISTHTPEQLAAACQAPVLPGYVAIGPVFPTSTKLTGLDAVGLERVCAAAEVTGARGLPLVAIGGITLDRAADVLRAGAASVAVISDLLSTGDPEGRVRAYVLRLGKV
jgi:thiamine-phosphate pyrophosphorylase